MFRRSPKQDAEIDHGEVSPGDMALDTLAGILRSMAGGASLAAYNMAYTQVTKAGKGVVPGSALVGEQAVAARKAGAPEPETEKVDRVRETSDLMWKRSSYGLVNCQCGTRMRVPPNYKGNTIRCPHCGTVNNISSKQ